MMRCVISCLVQNHPGVLAQISGLFAGRGYNIDSLSVGETENPEFSRMTIVSRGEEAVLEQIRKQLEKLVPSVKVVDLTDAPHVERELMLMKLSALPAQRSEILQIIGIFRARVVDVSAREMMIEISGVSAKIAAFLDLMRPFGIKDVARTGTIALSRGSPAPGDKREKPPTRRGEGK